MAEQAPTQIELAEVKADDLIGERMALWNAFTTATTWVIGATVVVLVLMVIFLV